MNPFCRFALAVYQKVAGVEVAEGLMVPVTPAMITEMGVKVVTGVVPG
jgi:hypothetical protein